ncbi:hypothetical protein JXR93_02675 [bacterium]|nr:hypothetical protein [bacterium]
MKTNFIFLFIVSLISFKLQAGTCSEGYYDSDLGTPVNCVIDPCSPCGENEKCVETRVGRRLTKSCNCDDGYYDKNLLTAVMDCVVDPCYYCGEHGECVQSQRGVLISKACNCDDGYIQNGLLKTEQCVPDWRDPNSELYLGGELPFPFQAGHIAPYTIEYNNDIDLISDPFDYNPNKGWVLLYNTNYISNVTDVKAVFSLYNRFLGLLRVFVLSGETSTYSALQVTLLPISPISPLKPSFFKEKDGLFYSDDYKNNLDTKSVVLLMNYNPNGWSYSDYKVNYNALTNREIDASIVISIKGLNITSYNFTGNISLNQEIQSSGNIDIIGIITKTIENTESMTTTVKSILSKITTSSTPSSGFIGKLIKNLFGAPESPLLKYAGPIGFAASLVSSIFGGGSSASPLSFSGKISLTGVSMSTNNLYYYKYFTPGAETSTPVSLKPAYDKTLGVFSLKKAPLVIEHMDENCFSCSGFYCDDDDKDFYTNIKLTLPKQNIEYNINPNLDLKLKRLYTAIVYKAPCDNSGFVFDSGFTFDSNINLVGKDEKTSQCIYQTKFVPYDFFKNFQYSTKIQITRKAELFCYNYYQNLRFNYGVKVLAQLENSDGNIYNFTDTYYPKKMFFREKYANSSKVRENNLNEFENDSFDNDILNNTENEQFYENDIFSYGSYNSSHNADNSTTFFENIQLSQKNEQHQEDDLDSKVIKKGKLTTLTFDNFFVNNYTNLTVLLKKANQTIQTISCTQESFIPSFEESEIDENEMLELIRKYYHSSATKTNTCSFTSPDIIGDNYEIYMRVNGNIGGIPFSYIRRTPLTITD